MHRFSNIPEKFPIACLSKFDFGSPDGKDDPLLLACMLKITPIAEFLEENKSIVVGERGAGKTALFRLISDGKLKFHTTEKFTQIYVPIDEELAYKTIREHVAHQIQDSAKSPEISHRIVWELYFLSRCIDALAKKFSENGRFNALCDDFYKAIGWTQNKKIGLLDFLRDTKKTIGVKLEGGHLGYVIPNFYTAIEPAKNEKPSDSSSFLDVPAIKSALNSFLKDSKTFVYLLVDKIDEFVSGDEYITQKLVLQALIQCWRDYQSHPNIKLKLFIRKDLYERMDFSAIGRDKIDPKKVELKWSTEDIQQFAANRIHYNICSAMKIKNLRFVFNEKSLNIDRDYLKKMKELNSLPEQELSWIKKVKWAYFKLRAHLRHQKRDEYDARTIDMRDAVCQTLLTTFFPRRVNHINKANKKEHIELPEYLATHFQFGSGCTTPRVIILYLQKCLENAKAYYRNNPDQQITLNDKGEYPLFLREHMLSAYNDVRVLCLKTILCLNEDLKNNAILIIRHMNNSRSNEKITFKTAKSLISKNSPQNTSTEEMLRRFFAFYEHAGLFSCVDRSLPPESRTYELPIFFQKVSF